MPLDWKRGAIWPDGHTLVGEFESSSSWNSNFSRSGRATDPDGRDVVIRSHPTRVGDDYGGITDLAEHFEPYCAFYDRIMDLPDLPGVAPWLAYEFDPAEGYFNLVRHHYDTPLAACFPPRITANPDGRPNADFLTAIREIAAGIDELAARLGDQADCAVHRHNLFVSDGHAVLTDYGVRGLARMIQAHDHGPQSGSALMLENPEFFLEPLPQASPGGNAQFCLAATYWHLRTGQALFRPAPANQNGSIVNRIMDLMQQLKEFAAGREIDLSTLPTHRERQALAQALSRDPGRRFDTCSAFVRALT